MTLLPIAARELRVASRRRVTFRVRWVMAIGAALVAFGLLAFTDVTASQSGGKFLFETLAWVSFGFATFAGVFLAADAIAEEKRDGTLGLLFLTDLSGFEVVTGKLLIVGLNAFLALAAVLPVMAVAWILGGVTGGEFWRLSLALLNTLFLSLALGLAVSSVAREQGRALTATFLGLAGLTGGFAMLHKLLLVKGGPTVLAWLCGVSPWVSFRWARDLAYRAAPDRYWSALWLAHGVAWACLLAASWLVRRRWRAGPSRREARPALEVRVEKGGKGVRVIRRAGGLDPVLLERNPMLALLAAERETAWQAWSLAVAAVLLVAGNLLAGNAPVLPFNKLPWVGGGLKWGGGLFFSVALSGLLVLLKTLFAWQGCMFFAQSRRQGALDAVLTTPLSDEAILSGQWGALRRRFLWPVTVFVGALALGPLFQAVLATGTGATTDHVAAWGVWLYTMVSLPLEFVAIGWLGTWFALTDPRPSWAFARTALITVLLPQLLFCVPQLLIAGVLFSYGRAKLNLPIRRILEGARDPAAYRALTPRRHWGR